MSAADQIKEKRRVIAEAQQELEARQQAEREPGVRIRQAQQEIAELERGQRAELFERAVGRNRDLTNSTDASFREVMQQLVAIYDEMARLTDLTLLQTAVAAFNSNLHLQEQHRGAVQQWVNEHRQIDGHDLAQERVRQLQQPRGGMLVLEQWFDEVHPGTRESLLRGVILYVMTGEQLYVDHWNESLIQRQRDRMVRRQGANGVPKTRIPQPK